MIFWGKYFWIFKWNLGISVGVPDIRQRGHYRFSGFTENQQLQQLSTVASVEGQRRGLKISWFLFKMPRSRSVSRSRSRSRSRSTSPRRKRKDRTYRKRGSRSHSRSRSKQRSRSPLNRRDRSPPRRRRNRYSRSRSRSRSPSIDRFGRTIPKRKDDETRKKEDQERLLEMERQRKM